MPTRFTVPCALLGLICASAIPALGQAPAAQPSPLSQRTAQCRGYGMNLPDLIDELCQQTNQNILVNWQALNQVHVTKNLLITVDLSNLRLDEALSKLVDAIGGNQARLGYSVDNGVIVITTGEELSKNLITKVYDITAASHTYSNPELLVERVTRIIRGIEPLSWKKAGGLGIVDYSNGQLIITQTPDVQARIAAELEPFLPAQNAAEPKP
jgi:hypothetical protein